jgi:hypothetical protein
MAPAQSRLNPDWYEEICCPPHERIVECRWQDANNGERHSIDAQCRT